MIQTTNIRRILDRVMRHPMMRDVPFETAVEYAVDFISLMGTPALYEEKTMVIAIKDWKGPLPCDFEQMIQVRVAPRQSCGCWRGYSFPMGPLTYRESGFSFHMSDMKPGNFNSASLTYKTQGMFIFTSTKDIDVEIAYRGYQVDDEGYPLLPDNASFLRGLENYVKLQWFTVLFDMGKISQNVMINAQQEYAWAAGDAQSEFSRLNLDKAETLFNSFKTLLPRNNEHWKQFFTNGSTEIFNGFSGGPNRGIAAVGTGSAPVTASSNEGCCCSSDGVKTVGNAIEVERIVTDTPSFLVDENMHLHVVDFNGNSIDIGKVGLTFASEPWNAQTEYEPYTYVVYEENGCSYISKEKNSNVVPGTAPTIWALAVRNTGGGSGGSGGGGSDTPVEPSVLEYPLLYGGTSTAVPVNDSATSIISGFSRSYKYITKNVPCNTKYYYLAIPGDYSLTSVITDNMENVTSMFERKGGIAYAGIVYNLHEFHLSSDIPLDVNITITIAG